MASKGRKSNHDAPVAVVKSQTKKYRSKPGPNPLSEEEKRLLFTVSLSNNRIEYGNLRTRFQDAVEFREGGTVSKNRLIDIALQQSYLGIAAYCDAVERDMEAISGDL